MLLFIKIECLKGFQHALENSDKNWSNIWIGRFRHVLKTSESLEIGRFNDGYWGSG
jgi:hypothetical protein